MNEPLNNADNFWLCVDEPTNLMVINGFMEFDGPIDYERFEATIETRLLALERFKKRIIHPVGGIGGPSWEIDSTFDIRSHVHRMALPAPGDEKSLRTVIADLTSTALDPSKPLWQIHLIEGYGDRAIAFFRIHHCIADGIALIFVLLNTADLDPDAPWPEARDVTMKIDETWDPLRPLRKAWQRAQAARERFAENGKRLIDELTDALSDADRMKELTQKAGGFTKDTLSVMSRILMLPSAPDTVFKGKQGVRKAVAWTRQMPLGNIRTVSRTVEATINDVLIATVTGSLRRYLKKMNNPVNELDLQVTVPVNIRKPGTEFELGNKFSLVFLSLPVHIEDPVLRLKEVHRRMDALKQSPEPLINFQALNLIGMAPRAVIKKASELFANKAAAVMTNVPGPRQAMYYAGREIKNMMFWVPRSGDVGLGISIFSYNGTVTVGLATDERLVPDPETILEGFEEEFYHLFDLVKSGKVFGEALVIHDRYAEANTEEADPSLCRSLTRSGRPCRNLRVNGSIYCRVHAFEDGEPEE